MKQKEDKNTVFVGMSGGVDSSVSSALLQESGYDVRGVFIKVWHPDWLACDWRKERQDAMRVAAHLGISFSTLDLSEEYKREVVDYMIGEYKLGRTPNPDVMCNKHIKFGGFFDWARQQGADYIATGHYARSTKSKIKNQKLKLLTAKDKEKDQSYFLWTLTQEQLAHTLFPIGGMQKIDVRKLARRLELPVADKKDSQGLCFLGKVDIPEFLSHYVDVEQGDVLNMSGKIIGSHNGAIFYTIGQRHGFTVTKKTPTNAPQYVVSKDMNNNTITVSEKYKEQPMLGVRKVALKETNWINTKPEGNYQARVRYRQKLQGCSIKNNTVTFDEPQHGVAVGQSCVLYLSADPPAEAASAQAGDDEICLGGGIIEV